MKMIKTYRNIDKKKFKEMIKQIIIYIFKLFYQRKLYTHDKIYNVQ